MNPVRESLSVETGSRLHFGLLSIAADPKSRRFGGLGLMIEPPRTRVVFEPAEAPEVHGRHAERALGVVRRWSDLRGVSPPPIRVTVASAPELHQGWGAGTQLALALVDGLERLAGRDTNDPGTLAHLAGRAERSTVGLYGFLRGGLIAESGKAEGEAVAALLGRVALPPQWRILLITPPAAAAWCGQRERDAFANLPVPPHDEIQAQRRQLEDEILPAAAAGDFDAFTRSLGEYNRRAGRWFSPAQGGPFATPEHEQLVAALLARGFLGSGQSSWGPTLFAFTRDESEAHALAGELLIDRRHFHIQVAAPRSAPREVFAG